MATTKSGAYGMTKKIVKLSVIRDDNDEPCPYGLKINWACRNVGNHIDSLFPLENLGPEAIPEEKQKVAEANVRAVVWSVMRSGEVPTPCKYAANLFPEKQDKVDCSYNDSAAGQKPNGALIGSPFYPTIFTGIGLDSLYSAPIGYYADFNVSRNSFYGLYSLLGSDISVNEEIKKLAEQLISTNKKT